jgi:hypothetical protein
LQGLLDGNDTDVTAVGSDQTDFWNPNALIDSKFIGAYILLLLSKRTTSPRLVFERANDTMPGGESSIKPNLFGYHRIYRVEDDGRKTSHSTT